MRDRMPLPHSVCHHHEFVKTSHRGSHETCSTQVLTEPNLSLWHSPAELTVQPKLVWKTFLDVVWFLAVLPIFELLEHLHQAGYLPFLFRLY